MNSQQLIDGFQFDNQAAVDNDIHPVGAFELDRFVGDGERNLAPKLESCILELEAQTFLIGRFQQTGPERAMNFNCMADDRFAQPIAMSVHAPHSSL